MAAWLFLSASLAAAAAAPAETAHPAQIDRNGVLILVRSTLFAVDAANKTGNYTVLRDLAAPGFAAANNAAKLGDIFAVDRREGLDLSGIAVLDPQLTLLPEIDQNGMMRMSGFFPSVPKQVNFELLYQPVAGQWRLFGISLNVGPSGPVAPQPPAPPPPAPAPVAAKINPKSRPRTEPNTNVKKSVTEPSAEAQKLPPKPEAN